MAPFLWYLWDKTEQEERKMKENYGWVRFVCVALSLILVIMGAWQFVELLCALPGQLAAWLAEGCFMFPG